ncbi:MAG TPA: YceI family protein [Prolixibacteraceae bacterium]|nr:YceI family protein [Prolixibacteraceae bacterium]HPS11678.1 YceI family protein [Prolixibacteraceae bacterium]
MKKLVGIFTLVLFVVLAANAQELKIDTSKSELNWTGKKVTGEHHGTIQLKEGSVTLKKDKVITGKFVIDMNTIKDLDLPAGEWNDKLVGHLKSDDFFGVQTYPEATLVLTGSTPFTNGKATVDGKLTIKGITNPVQFEVTKLDNQYTAQIVVDRSLYNVRYGSGKFFENLGDKTIYDNFTMDVKLVTE